MNVILLIILTSSNLFAATNLFKTTDGSQAFCMTSQDVARHDLSSAYRPLKVVKRRNRAEVLLEFVRCEEKGFQRDYHLESRIIKPVLKPDMALQLTRSRLNLIIFNGQGVVVDRQLLRKDENGIYKARFKTDVLTNKAFEISVQSIVTVKDNRRNEVIDEYFENLGSYKLMIE